LAAGTTAIPCTAEEAFPEVARPFIRVAAEVSPAAVRAPHLQEAVAGSTAVEVAAPVVVAGEVGLTVVVEEEGLLAAEVVGELQAEAAHTNSVESCSC